MPNTRSTVMSLESAFNELSKDDLIYYFLPIFLLALVLEWGYSRHKKLELFEPGDTKASLWMLLFVGFVDVAPKLLAIIVFFYLAGISPFEDLVQRQWWAWCLLFFLDDFTRGAFRNAYLKLKSKLLISLQGLSLYFRQKT